MRVAIVGPGLIGRSIALAARRADPSVRVTEIDRGDPLEAARGADLIVLAAPVDVILDVLHRSADVLRESVVLDTGSTKRAIVAAARAAKLTTFVGGHPMAGAASSGPAEARADLFDSRPWFLVPGGADAAVVEIARAFVAGLGAHPVVMNDDGAEHDRVMAAVSHLPQAVVSALMVVAADAAGVQLQWAGSGLRDTTRLAESSGRMWQSILDSNADELRPLLRTLARLLEQLASDLGNGRAVSELFDRANRARALL